MVGSRTDPLASYSFYVTVGEIQAAFREASGLGSESEVIEYKASDKDGKEVVMKVPGRLKWNNITLKRGITDSMALWDWRKKVEEGKVTEARRSGSIIMYNQSNEAIAAWHFDSAWPCKISGPQLNAGQNEIAVEEIEIAHEGLRREQ